MGWTKELNQEVGSCRVASGVRIKVVGSGFGSGITELGLGGKGQGVGSQSRIRWCGQIVGSKNDTRDP